MVQKYDPAPFSAQIKNILDIKPRYPDEDLYMSWYYGEKPTSRLARRIINAYLNDKSITIIIHGDPRIGKSGYAFKTLVQVYDYLYAIRDPIFLYRLTMGYHPTEILGMCRSVKRDHWFKPFRTAKQPALIWDDGGIWLFNQDYQKSHVKAIMKYFQILFTKVQVMIITTPTPANIVKGLRAIPSAVWIQIRREEEDPYLMDLEPDHIRYRRNSRIYSPFMSADLKTLKVWKNFEEYFDCRFPDSAFKHYQPIRETYTHKQEDLIYYESMLNDKKALALEQKRREALLKVIPDLIFNE
jgi:hypothetical protein